MMISFDDTIKLFKELERYVKTEDLEKYNCAIIGKLDECLFLTQAEAEQKLKEMDGD